MSGKGLIKGAREWGQEGLGKGVGEGGGKGGGKEGGERALIEVLNKTGIARCN